MNAKYLQPGNAISYLNSGSKDIQACEAVPLTTRLAVAGDTIKVGETGTLMLDGVWEMETDGSVFAVGDAVYYNAESGKVTTTSAGNCSAGIAVTAAQATDTVVCVRIG